MKGQHKIYIVRQRERDAEQILLFIFLSFNKYTYTPLIILYICERGQKVEKQNKKERRALGSGVKVAGLPLLKSGCWGCSSRVFWPPTSTPSSHTSSTLRSIALIHAAAAEPGAPRSSCSLCLSVSLGKKKLVRRRA